MILLPASPWSELMTGFFAAGAPGVGELANKIEVFGRFHSALVAARSADLEAPARRALVLPPWPSAFTLEGLAYGAVAWARASRTRPEDWLEALDRLPRALWLPLHTGLGIVLGVDAAERIARFEAPAEVLAAHWAACRKAARPGYVEAVFECFGFVAKNLRGFPLEICTAALARERPEHLGTFWHGWGRGSYFAPEHAWPGGTPQAFGRAATLAGMARGNVLAGLSWALTLVNLRHPEVIAARLRAAPADRQSRAAIRHGVGSALAIWSAIFANDPAVSRCEQSLGIARLAANHARPELFFTWRGGDL